MNTLQVVIDGLIYELNPTGGVARLHREIIGRLAALDSTLRIQLLTNRRTLPEIERSANVRITPVHPAIDRWLRPRRIFYEPVYRVTPLLKSLYAIRSGESIWHSTYYSRIARWPGHIVTTVYDMAHERFPDLFHSSSDSAFRREKRAALRDSDLIICISQATADDVTEILGIPAEKIRVVPPAASEVFFQPTPDERGQFLPYPYLLYVGDRRHYKNFGLLIRAFAHWRWRSEFKLVVVGRSWTAQEWESVRALKLEQSVIIVSDADDVHLRTLYHHAEAFVYPSLIEGFGIPILEAAACGCPVVVSDIPSSREIAGDFGFFFSPQSADSLNDALNSAVEKGRESVRVQRARTRASSYTWGQAARSTLEVYRELVY